MGKFVVPKSEQHAYKMLIQRANRRVKSNLKYINKNKIEDEHTQRSLVGGFNDPMKWSTRTMPFSRSNKGRYVWNATTEQQEFREFANEREYRQYLGYLSKWGKETKKGERFDAHPDQIKQGYKTNIIKSLNQVKDHYNISMPNGQIPKKVIDAIDSMSLEQITNFFGDGDPSEDIETSQFGSDDFAGVDDAEGFATVVIGRINAIKKFH